MPSRKRTHKRTRRIHRRRGGFIGAPLNDSLAGSWSSKMSLGQGGDFLVPHATQHGGAVFEGAPLNSMGATLPAALQGAAMLGPLQRSFSEIAGLKDQAGGYKARRGTALRRKHRKATKGKSHKGKSRKGGHKARRGTALRRNGQSACGGHRAHKARRGTAMRRRTRRRGGAIGYAPFPSAGMLDVDHSRAGLNPGWTGSVEFDASRARQTL